MIFTSAPDQGWYTDLHLSLACMLGLCVYKWLSLAVLQIVRIARA